MRGIGPRRAAALLSGGVYRLARVGSTDERKRSLSDFSGNHWQRSALAGGRASSGAEDAASVAAISARTAAGARSVPGVELVRQPAELQTRKTLASRLVEEARDAAWAGPVLNDHQR